MTRILHILAAAAASLTLGLAGPAAAQNNFYAGKTVNIIVGAGPGGGYDLYARALALHMPKYIPGSPTIVVQNMNSPLPMANSVYTAAPKDGTSIALGSPSIIAYQIIGGPNANYDPTKFAWLGRLWHANSLFVSWHTSGVATIADAKAKEIPFGTLSASNSTYMYPLLTNKLLGTKFKLVPGYVGEELDVALERGEIGAHTRMNVESLFTRYIPWVEGKKVNVVLQIGDNRDPRLPDVPTFKELVATERERQLIDLVTLESDMGHSYWVSPEVPADRLAILREAFRKTAEDAEFKAAMQKFGVSPRYETPAYLAARVTAVASVPSDLKAEAASILLPK